MTLVVMLWENAIATVPTASSTATSRTRRSPQAME